MSELENDRIAQQNMLATKVQNTYISKKSVGPMHTKEFCEKRI
jgi:hypothetical protein